MLSSIPDTSVTSQQGDDQFTCPIALMPMVIRITFLQEQHGQNFDLVSILEMYKKKYGNLEGNKPIECPLTRKTLTICPAELRPSNLIINLMKSKTFNEYVQLPNDIEIISFIFEKYDCELSKSPKGSKVLRKKLFLKTEIFIGEFP